MGAIKEENMKLVYLLLTLSLPTLGLSQSTRHSAQGAGSTHVMGSGSKSVHGYGISKDSAKYKRLSGKSREELQEEQVGNNPTSTDTIQGRNSRKIED